MNSAYGIPLAFCRSIASVARSPDYNACLELLFQVRHIGYENNAYEIECGPCNASWNVTARQNYLCLFVHVRDAPDC